MSQKGFAPIFIALILAVTLLGGYFIYQTQPAPKPSPASSDKTSNWKKYTNTQYNFEFKYPDDFTILDHSEDYIPPYELGTPIVIARKVGFKNDKAQYMQDVNFSISKSPDISKCYLDYNGQTITDRKLINGTDYYVTFARGAGAGHSIGGQRYHIIKNNLCFEISSINETSTGSGEEFETLKKQVDQDMKLLTGELDQILSTFKFTN